MRSLIKSLPSLLIKGCTFWLWIVLGSALWGQEDAVFYPAGSYDPAIPTPREVLGFSPGERPARYAEVIRYFQVLDERSERLRLVETGRTHEGRPLYYALITSEENMTRLEEIRSALSRLADPRKLSASAEAGRLIQNTPAVAWMMYSIHGDEISGTNASLQVAYHLVAGEDSLTRWIRRELIVGIDPCENPDGRERFLAQMQQWQGRLLHSDVQSIQHTGVWPWGRTNHYLFDLNRDWFILSQPESRARVEAIRRWNPQVVVDAHEMGPYDTYLFNPPREPINPNFPRITKRWSKIFAADQARAFDRHGWSYYTREWLEDWYPGYGSSWPFLLGAVGILYEQASTDGSLVKRPDGTTLTFSEAVQHQFVSSLANITTAAENRQALLQDFYALKKSTLTFARKTDPRAYLIVPGENPTRAHRLAERLLLAGVEIEVAEEPLPPLSLSSYRDRAPVRKRLPAGTLIIPLNQPLRPLINAALEFDPRMKTGFLQWERESLEKGEGTKLYEVTAWSMLLAFGLEAYTTASLPKVRHHRLSEIPSPRGGVENPRAAYGFLIGCQDDRAVNMLGRLLEKGYVVRVAEKDFRIEGRSFARGTLLLRRQENPPSLVEALEQLAGEEGVSVVGVSTALSEEGPDLGGNEFQLLEPPKIALLAGPRISSYSLGSIWHLLDQELGYPHSILNHTRLSSMDLRKYNLLILPSAGGNPSAYKSIFDEEQLKRLADWISDGGTLIAVGSAAAFVADSSTGLSQVKLRRQALKALEAYARAVEQERRLRRIRVDSLTVWEGGKTSTGATSPAEKSKQKQDLKRLQEEDRRLRLFHPRGAILNVELNPEHWLSFGVGDGVPAILYTDFAYLSRPPVQTVGRLADGKHLRLSGLLWPEARERWQNTAYLTREAKGKGQIILFAGEPVFRSYFYGTGRLLINAIFFGPGFGTRPVVEFR